MPYQSGLTASATMASVARNAAGERARRAIAYRQYLNKKHDGQRGLMLFHRRFDLWNKLLEWHIAWENEFCRYCEGNNIGEDTHD